MSDSPKRSLEFGVKYHTDQGGNVDFRVRDNDASIGAGLDLKPEGQFDQVRLDFTAPLSNGGSVTVEVTGGENSCGGKVTVKSLYLNHEAQRLLLHMGQRKIIIKILL